MDRELNNSAKHTINTWILVLLMGLCLLSCEHEVTLNPINLVTCASMPHPVAAGACFVYNNEAYVFGGRDNRGSYTNNMWRYNPIQDEWCLMDKTPLHRRVSASACVCNDVVYIGMGYKGPLHRDTAYLRDFWAYVPTTNEWKRLADFPANTTVKNCLFAHEGAIYALYGFYRQFTQDVYRYDIDKDAWEKIPIWVEEEMEDLLPRAMDIVGTTCQGRHFFGTGFNHTSLTFWAEWKPTELVFVPRQAIMGAGRNAAACCATRDFVYLAGGRHYGDTLTTGFFFNSLQRYCPINDRWEYKGALPYKAENMVMVGLNEQIYIGLGENTDGIIQNNWYRVEE